MSNKEDSQSIIIKKRSPLFVAIVTILIGCTVSFVAYDHQKIVELDSARGIHEHKINTNSQNHDALMRENRLDHVDIKEDVKQILEGISIIKGQLMSKKTYKEGGNYEKNNHIGIASAIGDRMRKLQDKRRIRESN